jgi:hypothetical protein
MRDISAFLAYFFKRSPVLLVLLLSTTLVAFRQSGSALVFLFVSIGLLVIMIVAYIQWKRDRS